MHIHTKNKNTIKMVNIFALICTYYNYELRGCMMMVYGLLYHSHTTSQEYDVQIYSYASELE